METFDQILSSASMLPMDDRRRLIDALWETFPEEQATVLSPEWMEEIQRRSDAVDRGEEKTFPLSEVMDRIMKRASPNG